MKRKAGRKRAPIELPVFRELHSPCSGGCGVCIVRLTLDRSVYAIYDHCPKCMRVARQKWIERFDATEAWIHCTFTERMDAEDRAVEMSKRDSSREYSYWQDEPLWEVISVPRPQWLLDRLKELKEKAHAT